MLQLDEVPREGRGLVHDDMVAEVAYPFDGEEVQKANQEHISDVSEPPVIWLRDVELEFREELIPDTGHEVRTRPERAGPSAKQRPEYDDRCHDDIFCLKLEIHAEGLGHKVKIEGKEESNGIP